ncbi:hypothetical protein [Actinokineospora spheciospongiae]|uniref:hypothetical protein n=1 Tax=Actinokineospora spheciospongiae TaxID=909613 RepID=UPI000D855207|nr:hypothetical protein [Actinokineospora spheciospongiae]PWW65605.1 hypothetical protein DFQ13_102360 [Actinokineospora spheciospongiae]
MPSHPRHPVPEPPTQTAYLPGNLIDLIVIPDHLLSAALTGSLTLGDIANLAIALDDVTTCLRWLLNNPTNHHARTLRAEFAIFEFKPSTQSDSPRENT